MDNLKLNLIYEYVENNIMNFHNSRIAAIENIELQKILKKKNPYLFRAKAFILPSDLVKSLTEAYIISSEETIFGDWLEGLAIFVSEKSFNGRKSGIEGIDLEFDNSGKRYIINIKSGPNWGNSSQIKKMVDDFNKAKRTLRTSRSDIEVIAVNGCCYGKDNKPDKGSYLKYCGQRFWEFISGDQNLYSDLIEPVGFKAKEKNEEYLIMRDNIVAKLTLGFYKDFSTESGKIDWDKLLKFNSGYK